MLFKCAPSRRRGSASNHKTAKDLGSILGNRYYSVSVQAEHGKSNNLLLLIYKQVYPCIWHSNTFVTKGVWNTKSLIWYGNEGCLEYEEFAVVDIFMEKWNKHLMKNHTE